MNTGSHMPDRDDPRRGEPGRSVDGLLPADIAGLGRALDARGRSQREALSAEALERIAAMSDLQLPIAQPDATVVVARIGPGRSRSAALWRIAAAIAIVAGLGAAAVLLSRGSGGDEPLPGTLVDGGGPGRETGTEKRTAPAPTPAGAPSAAVAGASPAALAPEHLEHALASSTLRSASTVVVALSGSLNEPAIHYHDLDDAVAADIAPLFHAGSLLDGGGVTYEDLSGELAAIVSPGSFR